MDFGKWMHCSFSAPTTPVMQMHKQKANSAHEKESIKAYVEFTEIINGSIFHINNLTMVIKCVINMSCK